MLSKKIIITLIVLIIIAFLAPRVFDKKTNINQTTENISPRNDLVADISTTTATTTE